MRGFPLFIMACGGTAFEDARPSESDVDFDADSDTDSDSDSDSDSDADADSDADSDSDADTDADSDADSDRDVDGGPCSLGPHAQAFELSVSHGAGVRQAVVDLPVDYDGTRTLPVVLNFHGLAMTAELQRAYTGMHTAANARGWIAVHPKGENFTWNVLPGSSDVDFIDALLDELEATVCVDPQRVYATGLSQGGFFSYMLGCELSERLAAIAPVAGSNANLFCMPSEVVPLLHIHGNQDGTVPYGGSFVFPSAPDAVQNWADDINGCNAAPVPSFSNGDAFCETRSCGPEDEATLCTLDGGGHNWPGAMAIPLLPSISPDLPATTTVLDFFEPYRRQ